LYFLVKGGIFLLAQIFWPETVQNQGYMAFFGVLVSFFIFATVIAIISFCGGVVGRISLRHTPND